MQYRNHSNFIDSNRIDNFRHKATISDSMRKQNNN